MAITDINPEVEEPEFKGKTIEQLKKMRSSAEEAHQFARELSRRDTDWYDNFDNTQWTDEEKEELIARGQPIVTMNRVKKKVNFMLGFEQRGRSDPKAYPRNPSDEQAADVATDVMDYIEQRSRFDREASLCFKDQILSGIEVCEVVLSDDEIKADRIDVAKFFYDPRSRETNFSDARYMGYADWYDLEEANDLFPGNELELEDATGNNEEGDEDKADKPWLIWEDANRQRVLISVIYYKMGGDWKYAIHTGADILEEGDSLYLDDKKRPTNPIIAQSVYVTRNNERYGAVRDMIGPQMEMNYRRSMSLFLLKNRRMWQRDKSIFPNPKQAKLEAGKADGLLTANGEIGRDWGFIDSTAEIGGNFELLQDAKLELEIQGPNAGLQGRGVENQSGKAIIAQQNAGITEENSLYDAHNDFKLRCYQAMWVRAKQFWTEEKFIRVTDDENAFRFAHVNVPAMHTDPQTGEPIIDPMTGQPMPRMEIDPKTGMPAVDPETGQPVRAMDNALAEMDVDIVIDAGPDTVTQQAEQFDALVGMSNAGVQFPPDVIIMASNLRNKKELLEKLEQAGQNPEAQQAMQLQIEKLQLELEEMKTGIMLDQANIGLTQANTQKAEASAMKDTVEAQKNAVTPIIIG
ncbi:MAG: hypothetical protein JKY81_01760 [Colwellia sp.]|nr:hypothetical protein [Colwellia sp.]